MTATIRVTVERVNVPAWSTIGYGYGRDSAGRAVTFAGDHRAMRHIGESLGTVDEVIVHLDYTQILDIEDVDTRDHKLPC